MRAVPDFKPTVVGLCLACGKLQDRSNVLCLECQSSDVQHRVRLGADLLNPNDPRLDKYREAGEL